MKKLLFPGISFLSLLLIFMACTPRAAPPPAPSPAPAPPQAMPAPSPEDAAWAKVVEEAKKEGSVAANSFNLRGDTGTAVKRAFEEKYGIKLEVVVAGAGVIGLERLTSERAAKKYITDLFETGPSIVVRAASLGFTDRAELPVLQQSGVWRQEPRFSPDGHVLVVGQGFMAPFVNTNLVQPGREPKALRELVNPQWEGSKIGIHSPVAIALPSYVYYYREKYGVDDEFFRQLVKKQVRIAPSAPDLNSWLARGEFAIAVLSNDAQMGPLVKEGAPIRAIEVQGGAMLYPMPTIAMVKDAPHPNAARLFLNWLLSPEGQHTVMKAMGSNPNRKDVPDFGAEVFGFKPQKTFSVTFEDDANISRLHRELVVAKIMGVEK